MANLTISLDDKLIKQARIKAIQEGTSLSAKVREMLAQYVKQQPCFSASSVPPPLPTSKGTGGLRPGIDPRANIGLPGANDLDPGAAHQP